ncbi:MAG: FtsX-like permease family protein [Bryobacteraceae bacterium]|jgi:ABC-type antimicrobial peptide transport system permease subunit
MQATEYNTAMIDIRVAGDPAGVLPAVRRVIESLGRHIVLRAETLDQRAAMLLNTDRIMAMLSSFLAGLALLLAAVGLYGLMSYVVSIRTSEIGVRMALGARPGWALKLVFREAAWLVAMGFVAGIGAALGSSRLISQMVFHAGMSDRGVIQFIRPTANRQPLPPLPSSRARVYDDWSHNVLTNVLEVFAWNPLAGIFWEPWERAHSRRPRPPRRKRDLRGRAIPSFMLPR